MNDIKHSARAIAHTLLNHEKTKGELTEDIIKQIIEKVSIINIDPTKPIDKDDLFEILMADFSIGKGSITMLSEDVEPWVKENKVNINWELWHRYKSYMAEKDPSFPVNDLDDFTEKILDKCVNPKTEGSWDRRGMVVGHVQSGKTSNYVGLINKATDAGYKVIIVIAGTISSLRRQTQERIDEGYIGRSSSAFINNNGENRIIGAGKYKVGTDIYSLSSSYYKTGDEGDFNQAIANRLNIPIGKNPVVFVIKKNKGILENLIDWFSKNDNIKTIDGHPKLFDVPVLIIDDEADAASVNASKDINDIKTINKLIRTLLNVFDQNTFIGYTATPYANLFISQEYNSELKTLVKGKEYLIGDDLFPRDFIINIKAAKNYIGAAKVFGLEDPVTGEFNEPLNVFRKIDDYDPPFFKTINKNNKDDLPEYLPKSLELAIKSFILTCTIRRLRGHEKKHNSMLVHVALYVKWIDRVALLVNEKIREFKNKIESNDGKFIEELKELFENDFEPTTISTLENLDYTDVRLKNHLWEDVRSELKNAVSKIDVRSVHGTRSTTNLEYHNIEEIDYGRYENGLSVIAVGGSRLARGITLEGLSVSYYLRTTKMYDSLMQMGRWFGYRPGYVDLCRLFTTEQIYEWFNHITMATEEMRNDFDEMTVTHQKPKDFRLKVRNHHGLMTITSVAKLYWAQNISISFSGSNPQTYQLLKSEYAIKNNFKVFENLISEIGFPLEINRLKKKSGKIKYLFYKNQKIDDICGFLDSYKIDQPNIKNGTLTDYIKAQNKNNNISNWNICVVSNTDEKVFIDWNGTASKEGRKPNEDVQEYQLKYQNEIIKLGCSIRNQKGISRSSENYLISKNQIDDLKDRQVDLSINDLLTNEQIKLQRSKEKKGLLLIYALDDRGTSNADFGVPIIGYSLHFPKVDNEVKVSYMATTKDDFENEPMDDDDNPENE
ncbi:Z1 domain-containing protein [Flavobacterium sp. F-380]|uniref:Z1 domain-containing protein n=1 Tax=Flavobacterium kayseriense TaxID=2764714 RepID=A0ABR7JBM9_9FLAO|nr:Z1 domain-containing protein [Flavobacterium kayseriense]MBC5842632.1 Z1 domain-containing protein [Flavobacterium kayseriense]MBC5849162.1 Z1 domain-containing protein [Flavobacterium kayseriense]